ncbi:MAG: DUF2807 domain-containing protein [Cyclobacteriaceae bacterium]|jgi:hypothetical protein|nr:DUF2807 domain-containing protein [Cyclobacteriaceae bacterium]
MKPTLLLVFLLGSTLLFAQSEEKPLDTFDRIVASQYVNVILEKGEKESIRMEYSGIDPEVVNVKVRRKKLHIYLDDAKLVGKQDKYYYNGDKYTRSRYRGSSITAYITYRELRGLEIRGEEELVCNGAINADKFKLKVYGESEVTLASLQTNRFKASIFGTNRIEIKAGAAGHQLYRLFGENKIDTQHLSSNTAASRIYGEGRLTLNANDELKITAFGEPEIRLSGPAHINKNLILGNADIKVKRQ